MSGCPFRNALENAKAAQQSKNNNNNIDATLANGGTGITPNTIPLGTTDITKTTNTGTQTGLGQHDNDRHTLGVSPSTPSLQYSPQGLSPSPVRVSHSSPGLAPRNKGSDPTSSPSRKTSNMSSCSMGSDETEGERKLDLLGLIESVGTLMLPSVSFYYYDVYT